MRYLAIIFAVALALGCGAPMALPPVHCSPTTVQTARGAQPALVGRVAGCPNLVAVAGDEPGITLYVLRVNLDISDEQLQQLPEVQRGA